MTLGSAGNTTNTTLRGLTRNLLGTTSTSYPYTDALIDGWLNLYYHIIGDIILRLYQDSWSFVGNTEQRNLVAGTNQYTLTASDILGLRRVEINYTGGTSTFVVVRPIDEQAIKSAIKNASQTVTLPQAAKGNPFYRMVNTVTIEIHPFPDLAVTNWLYIEYEDEITELSATTDSPSFILAFHPLLAYGAAMEIAKPKLPDRYKDLKIMYEEIKELMITFYSNRLKQKSRRITPFSRKYR